MSSPAAKIRRLMRRIEANPGKFISIDYMTIEKMTEIVAKVDVSLKPSVLKSFNDMAKGLKNEQPSG